MLRVARRRVQKERPSDARQNGGVEPVDDMSGGSSGPLRDTSLSCKNGLGNVFLTTLATFRSLESHEESRPPANCR